MFAEKILMGLLILLSAPVIAKIKNQLMIRTIYLPPIFIPPL